MNNTINEIKTAKEKLERELAILVGAALFKFRQENNIIVNGIFFDFTPIYQVGEAKMLDCLTDCKITIEV